jgi:serine/threonine-protein kinase
MAQTRQLAAIMFTDIVGYTALMGDDEQKAFEILNKNRRLQKPLIEKYGGRCIKELGDGVLASFNTVSDAVNAAIQIQKSCNLTKDFLLRIGIHHGEIVFEENDIFGDAVNIASRLQALAPIGGIWVSESVHNNVANKKEINTKFVRAETLKNVKEPVRIYEVTTHDNQTELMSPTLDKIQAKTPVDKSIAVLPFVNMSNDPEQEYFSDGITEEIINVLAQIKELKVVGRTSSFSFKGKNQDLRIIGEQLSVKLILEGSVRKVGNKLRITVQLIDVEDGYHLWSERYDRQMEDIFDIQDEISLAILKELKVKLFSNEKEKVLKRHTENTEAYQLYLQGRFHYNQWAGLSGYKIAIEYYNKAIEKEPNYALAYAGLASCYLNLWFFSHLPPEQSVPHMKDTTHRSLALDNNIAESHVSLARMKCWYEWDFAKAEEEYRKAIELNPNHAEAHEQYGMMLAHLSRKSEALAEAELALTLDPFSLMINWGVGWINWIVGNYDRGIIQGKRLIEFEPNFFGGHLILGNNLLTIGKYEEAIVELKIAVSQNYGSFTLVYMGLVYGIMGEQNKAKEILNELLEMRKVQPVGSYELGLAYASVGENDIAIDNLEEAFEKHEGSMVFLKAFAQLIPTFISDLRLINLLERIGLPLTNISNRQTNK